MFLVRRECGDAGPVQAVGLFVGLNDDGLLLTLDNLGRLAGESLGVTAVIHRLKRQLVPAAATVPATPACDAHCRSATRLPDGHSVAGGSGLSQPLACLIHEFARVIDMRTDQLAAALDDVARRDHGVNICGSCAEHQCGHRIAVAVQMR